MDIGEQTAGLGFDGWFEEGQEAVNAKAVVRRKMVVEVFMVDNGSGNGGWSWFRLFEGVVG